MDEGALWTRVLEGSREAFDQIYRQYSADVRSFVRHYLQDPSAAEDLVQETFLQLWKRPNGFDPTRGALKQYLLGIARKRAAQWRRETPLNLPIDGEEPAVDHTSDGAILRRALEQLENEQRALLWLR